MNLYTPLRRLGPFRLLKLHPARESREMYGLGEIKCTLGKFSHCIWGTDDTLSLEQKYEVLEYYWTEDNEEELVTPILLNGREYDIDTVLYDALLAVRLESEPRYLWIDRICIDWSDSFEPRQQELLRMHLYKNATKVMLWIGEDEEDGDRLAFYLLPRPPPSSSSIPPPPPPPPNQHPEEDPSTKAAFDLATALIHPSTGKSKAERLIKEITPELPKARWCYLANLFYRPWFRHADILRKNYVDELNEFEIMCGASTVPWSTLSLAAHLIRDLAPVPQIFKERRYRDTRVIIPKEERSKMLSWLQARAYFGFDPERTAAQVLQTCSTTEPDNMSPYLRLLINQDYGLNIHLSNLDQLDIAMLRISEEQPEGEWEREVQPPLPTLRYPIDVREDVIANCLAAERFPDDPDMQQFTATWSRGVNLWLQRCSNVIRNRRIIITEKGYFGLVHRYVKVGDKVCILFGCSLPVISRKWNWEQHLFLGDCSIEGWINGEIIEKVGGGEVIANKVTEETFKKWLDEPNTMLEGESEPRALFLV